MEHLSETKSKKDLQSARTIALIQDSATRLFVSSGYNGTSIADIAKATNMTKGALYGHFSGKGALLLSLISEWESDFLDPLIEEINSHSGDAWAKLHLWFNITAGYAGENRELCLLRTILTAEMSGTDNEFERDLSRINSKYALFFRRLIEQGKSQGVFDADLDTHTLAYSIMALMDGTLLQWYHSYKYVEGPDMVRIGRRMMFHGIRPRLKTEGSHDWRPDGAVSRPSTSVLNNKS